MRLMIGFILAVMGADSRSGRQPITETLAQSGKQLRVDGLAGKDRCRHLEP
jgi:hypothetical protein